MMTGSEIFLDTNILVYSSLKDFDDEKHSLCQRVIKNLNESDFSINISTQILREFYAVVTGKRYLTQPLAPDEAKEQILYFNSVFNVNNLLPMLLYFEFAHLHAPPLLFSLFLPAPAKIA